MRGAFAFKRADGIKNFMTFLFFFKSHLFLEAYTRRALTSAYKNIRWSGLYEVRELFCTTLCVLV